MDYLSKLPAELLLKIVENLPEPDEDDERYNPNGMLGASRRPLLDCSFLTFDLLLSELCCNECTPPAIQL
jgi:hypothetical protein